ncbi:MAG TPA: RNA polymerase sigma factor [Prolixibacteraceae bacterium]|nr:RNA polymerase sigma factor [Prolixibacteraceae bacterium]
MIFRRKNKTSSDSQLMQQIVAGDQAAFSELYLRYKSRMYYYFYRMLGNSTDQANDFLQELFMKLIEKPESYRAEYNFSTWLYSIANNMCKNEYRRRSIRKEYQDEKTTIASFEQISDAGIEPEQLMEKIFQTLELLGEEHRSAFLLRYREGFSVKEVAEILDLAEGTVKSRLFYARKLLAEKLNYLKDEIEF